MKTYEELLSDIEDDMELMGALHIVYAMEENGVLTGYDYLPEEPYTISVTLKDLQEKIHQQMLYDKASAYTYDSDKSAPKLAVIFPGVGYTADKPLLYYTSRLAIKHNRLCRISTGIPMAAFSLFPKASVQLSLPLMLPDII